MEAQRSTEPVTKYVTSVVQLLKLSYDDACSRYVELFLDREDSDSSADRLSEQTLLVFLVDETDLIPTLRKQQETPDMGRFSLEFFDPMQHKPWTE